jgi:nitrite reductase/ring-hydroxylating ferredoxin subunit
LPDDVTSNRSLERNPELAVASVYEREIEASLERVWENVYDWEHLPFLHSQAFSAIEKTDSGAWGWQARIGIGEETGDGKRPEIELELVTDRPNSKYVSRTLAGPGAPSEIWTHLDPVGAHRTAIRVEFCVAPAPDEAMRLIGKGFVSLYTLLWDQDEEMMQTREAELSRIFARRESSKPHGASGSESLGRALGSLDTVRKKLPFSVEWGGESFRIVEVEGGGDEVELVAYGAVCPHLLGPMDKAKIVDETVICPWHGYAFNLRSGRSCDGQSLRLAKAPKVVVDSETNEVRLYPVEPL